ncbi:hypothetical protein F2Q68_00034935, partial [Brassica cretica]
MGDGNMNSVPSYASASSSDALFPPCAKLPFHGVELQPSSVCPKNFVVFDQTYDRSQVMYHPELTPRLVNSGLASSFHNEYVAGSYGNYGRQEVSSSSSHQEDPNEIDALLMSTDEDEEDDESEDGGDSEELPFHGVELQPSSVCPKNFVVFDQTYDRSQVMYHPVLTPRLVNSGLASSFQNEYVVGGYGNYGQQEVSSSSSHQEDPNEIDALLMSTDEDEGEDDDESEDGGDSEE